MIFSQDHSEPDLDGKPSVVDHSNYYGFYWTEGLRGVGWAREAVPPIKCGSSVGIASPPAVWSPYEDIVGTINIRDAERLQGFPEDWTNITTETGKDIKEGARWRLVGNAVSVRVSKWIGENLSQPKGSISDFEGELVTKTWPSAAWGYGDKKYKVPVSKWVANTEQIAISEFLNHPFVISGLNWEIDGDLWRDEFQLTDGENVRMSVSKKWLSWGDSYHLQIAYEEDVLICTAIAIVLDMVLYNDEDESIF